MKHITSRMIFSSFGGFFAGPARCATAIVREGDNTGPGGAGANMAATEKFAAEVAQLTVKAGKEIIGDIERAVLHRVGVKVVLYPLRKMRWVDMESKESLDPVMAAMAWHYAHALNYMEDVVELARQGRIFSTGCVLRTLMEVTHNGIWMVHSKDNAEIRARIFFDYLRESEKVVYGNHAAHLQAVRAGKNMIRAEHSVNSFKNKMGKFGSNVYWFSFRQKLESMKVERNYWLYYQPLCDVVHGKGPWGVPYTDGGEDVLLMAACNFFGALAERTSEFYGISEKFQSAFRAAIHKHRELSQAVMSDADRQFSKHGES